MPSIERIETGDAPKAIGPYSQGIALSLNAGERLIFVSGMLPLDPKLGKLVEGDIKELTRRVILNLEAVLKAGGSGLDRVVRTEVFLKDLKEFGGMNEEYAKWFVGPVNPVRQTIQAADLPLGSRIEISCIAVTG
jgi:2-iminobutanoate/2-iminopropanoate deaminase